MKAQLTSLSHVILSQWSSKPDSNPSPPLDAALSSSFVKPPLIIRSLAIHSVCTFIEHVVSAGTGYTASALAELRI